MALIKSGLAKDSSLIIVERDVRLEVLQIGIDEQVDGDHGNHDGHLYGQGEAPARPFLGQRAHVVAAATLFICMC